MNVQASKFMSITKLLKVLETISPAGCVQLSRDMFEEIHHNVPARWMHNFPLDSVNEEGVKFWTAPKRPPRPLKYNPDDQRIMEFIHAGANIFGFIFGLDEISMKDCIELSNNIIVPEFKPGSMTVKLNDDDDVQEGTD